MAECTNHPTVEAAQFCPSCGRPFCADCLVEIQGTRYCGTCKDARVRDLQRVQTYNLPNEALTYSIVGIFCFGIILEPMALSRAIRALREISQNPQLPGREKAVAAKWISIIALILWAVAIIVQVASIGAGS